MRTVATERRTKRVRMFPRRVRDAVLTAHVMICVGLLGDVAGFLAVAIRLSHTSDPRSAAELIEVLRMFGTMFSIALSAGAIVSGILLGTGTKWGVLRYPWVVAKLLLIVSVMFVGGVVIGPALDSVRSGASEPAARLIAAASYDLAALALATGLSVFKPGRPLHSPQINAATASASRES